jgi:microcin C transport system permease protein
MDARVPNTQPETGTIGATGLAVPPERRPLAISPINRRRWENFKKNRRGYWSCRCSPSSSPTTSRS